MLTKEASNALLKTLEEPPPHVIFVLATTETHKVLPTILSRCQRFDFHRISQTDVVAKLSHISKIEGIHIEPESLKLIARATTGSLRDAENLLQQLTTYYGADIELQQVQAILGISGDWRAKELIKHIVNNDISAGVATINSINSDGLDLRQFNRELVEYLRALLLIKSSSDAAIDLTAEDRDELKDLAAKASLPQILKAVKLFGQLELGLDNYSTLPLELALIDCTLPAVEEKKEPARQVEPQKPAKMAAQETARQAEKASTAYKEVEHQVARAETAKAPATASPVTKSAIKAVKVEQAKAPEPAPVSEPASTQKTIPPAIENKSVKPLSSEIEQLRLNWRKFIMEAPGGIGRTPAAALLRSAIPKAIENDTIVLSFKYPLHKENMEKLDNQKTAEKIVSGFLGRSCRLRCVYEPGNDHLVKAALRMGAQIIDAEEK